jgi:hypothetical protein
VYGYIEYRDFHDARWRKGFVAALQDGRFVSGGPPAYTYTKQVDRESG